MFLNHTPSRPEARKAVRPLTASPISSQSIACEDIVVLSAFRSRECTLSWGRACEPCDYHKQVARMVYPASKSGSCTHTHTLAFRGKGQTVGSVATFASFTCHLCVTIGKDSPSRRMHISIFNASLPFPRNHNCTGAPFKARVGI